MAKKVVPVDYTSRDFDSIKKDLLSYVKRYYPNTYKDFNEASFGSLMVDLVSYIGDNLSFYLDYNANESFLQTSLEYDNVVMHAKSLGYKHSTSRQSVGLLDIYVPIPTVENETRPDLRYLPMILKGSRFSSEGGNAFTLSKDVSFLSSNTELVTNNVSADGSSVTYYIAKVKGEIVSGAERQVQIQVEDFKRFLKIEIPDESTTEILEVVDSQGNKYYEVEYLSQNVIYRAIKNDNSETNSTSPSVMRALPVPRRYVVERDKEKTYLVFGYGSEKDIKNEVVADPSEVVLNIHGKNYVSSTSFDPHKLVSSEKFGVSPVNTTLTILYRSNTSENVNAAVGTVSQVVEPIIQFDSEHNLDPSKTSYIRNNIQVYNEEPINGDVTSLTTEELKRRALAVFATQNRAVTKQDYISMAYAMPASFGSVKRCNVYRDNDDFRRNMNMYVISEGSDGKLERSGTTLKNNLKTWLNSVRMLSDSLDITDATIINLGVEFDVIAHDDVNKNVVFNKCKDEIYEKLTEVYAEIGEPFYISEVFKILKNIPEVLDVVNVRVVSHGDEAKGYSSYMYNIEDNLSPAGRSIFIPHWGIWEIKFSSDVRGRVR